LHSLWLEIVVELCKLAFVSAVLLFAPESLFAQEPLRAGTIFSATQAPLWAAKEGRYFEKYGIKNLEVIQFSDGQPVTRALIGGDIQISTTGGVQWSTPGSRAPTP
jgi:ABC-type nitrate/sulfonate/bicarbonate transport system substrate-binding protein